MRQILQIVPRLPRAEGGVVGYAHALARQLEERLAIETRFVEVDDATPPDLAAGDTVLLHYANYAYQRRGCPERLVSRLEAWRRSGGRLVTLFHEVYAGGPPWRSSFWLGPRQRRLAARTARVSDRLVTTLDLYAALVRGLVPGAEIAVAPVFSTVGEPAEVPPFRERPKAMIVFGGSGVRRRTWEGHRETLLAACRALEIREVLDVGPPTGLSPSLDGLPVRVLGALPEEEVSRRMLAAVAGFLTYPSAFLPKSTIYAAYCAHGLVPVCAANGVADDPAAAAAAARAWYLDHSLERQGELFGRLLGEGA